MSASSIGEPINDLGLAQAAVLSQHGFFVFGRVWMLLMRGVPISQHACSLDGPSTISLE